MPAGRADRTLLRAAGYAALAGIGAAAIALGVGELVAAAVSAASAPLVAVGGVVIDNVPESRQAVRDRRLRHQRQAGPADRHGRSCCACSRPCSACCGLRRLWIGLRGHRAFGAGRRGRRGHPDRGHRVWALPSLVGTIGAAGGAVGAASASCPPGLPAAAPAPGSDGAGAPEGSTERRRVPAGGGRGDRRRGRVRRPGRARAWASSPSVNEARTPSRPALPTPVGAGVAGPRGRLPPGCTLRHPERRLLPHRHGAGRAPGRPGRLEADDPRPGRATRSR